MVPTSLVPPAGPRAQGWTGKRRSGLGQCLAEVGGFTLSPSARTGPSRLGPAGEGRSDGGVLHLHPRGQARYPEGGRRREDEPHGEGWRVRADAGDDEHQGDEGLENPHAGARAPVPPVYGSGRPAFSPPTVLRGRGRIFPAPARGNPSLTLERRRPVTENSQYAEFAGRILRAYCRCGANWGYSHNVCTIA